MNETGQGWEYRIEAFVAGQDRVLAAQARMNALGAEGWDLFHISQVYPPMSTEPTYLQYVFRRPREL